MVSEFFLRTRHRIKQYYMKKYIKPSAEVVNICFEGVFALSEVTNIPVGGEGQGGAEMLSSGKRGWINKQW